MRQGATRMTTLPVGSRSATRCSAVPTSSSSCTSETTGRMPCPTSCVSASLARAVSSGQPLGPRPQLKSPDGDVLEQDDVERDAGNVSPGVPDRHEPSAPPDRPQRRLGPAIADRIDNQVGPVTGDLPDPLLEVLLDVINARFRAQLLADRESLRRGGGRDDAGAQPDRDVDRRRANASRGAKDHHPLPWPQPARGDQRVVSGQVGHAERGRLGHRQAARDRRDRARRDQHLLGHGAGENRAVDEIPWRQSRHSLAHGRHPARELAARGERKRGRHLVTVGDEEQVGEVHRGRRHVHEHVTRGDLRTRDVADDDVTWTAVLFAASCPHASSPQLAVNRITK